MTSPAGPWRQAVRTGLLWGVGAIFISLVGLIEALQQRQIITGVISGGHTVLFVLILVAGLSAARQQGDYHASRQLAAAALAGAIAALLIGLLLLASTVVNF